MPKYILLIAGWLLSLGANGQTPERAPLVTDRPTQNTGAAVVPVGSVQLENGIVKLWKKDLFNTIYNDFYAGGLARIGILPFAELRVQKYYRRTREKVDVSGYTPNNPDDGLIDPNNYRTRTYAAGTPWNLGTKINFLPSQGWLPAIALVYDVDFNRKTVTNEGLKRFLTHNLYLCLDQQPAENWLIGYNVGISYLRGEWGFANYALAVSHSLSSKWGIFLEGYGDFPFQDIEDYYQEQALDAGLTYLVSPRFQLDLYGGRGLTDYSHKWMLGGGFSVRFLK